jgi:hypothetical protein
MVPLKILLVMALIGAVNRYGHPIRAAAVLAGLTAVGGVLGMFGGVPATAVAITTGIAFGAAAIVFWLVDNVQGAFLGVIVTSWGPVP